MIEHIDFEEQYVNDDGKRPDMTVMLTGERVIPVDSKVPMDEYLLYAECTDNNERAAHLDKHIRAVKRHIDALGKKEYWKSAERSVQFVVMVVPYESGLSAIFEAVPPALAIYSIFLRAIPPRVKTFSFSFSLFSPF